MKRNWKFIFAGAIAVCMLTAVAGCGNSASKSKNIDDLIEDDFEKVAAELDDKGKDSANETTEPQLKEIDPFENLNVSFSGISPHINISYTGGNSYVNYSPSIEHNLKNGDTVTMTAELKNTGVDKYTLTATEHEYNIEGFSSYIDKLDNIPQDTMDKMDTTLRDAYAAKLAGLNNVTCTIQNMDLIGNYLLFEKSATANYGTVNYIYFVYKIKVDFTYRGETETHEYYWCAYYSNVLSLEDGIISADYEDLHMGKMDYFLADIWQIESCEDLDALFNKNVTANIDQYNYESTVE